MGGKPEPPHMFWRFVVPGVMPALRSSKLLWKVSAGRLVVSWNPLAIAGR
jgi:hypothetical protein